MFITRFKGISQKNSFNINAIPALFKQITTLNMSSKAKKTNEKNNNNLSTRITRQTYKNIKNNEQFLLNDEKDQQTVKKKSKNSTKKTATSDPTTPKAKRTKTEHEREIVEPLKKTKTKSKKNNSVQPIKDDIEIDDVPIIKQEDGTSEFSSENDIPTSRKFVGAHTSVQGGLENAVFDAVKMGAKAFGLFLRSQRQWNCKPLEDTAAEKFKKAYKEHGFSPNVILPHGSYLLNCGAPNEETLKKSREALIDELRRCEKLGLLLYNFHPGSTCGRITIEECTNRIAESINQAHEATTYAITVVENMSCQGHTIGGDFKELKQIIDKVKDKTRIGVCLDTCHAFAAGYDLSTEEGFNTMMEEFEKTIGFHYLRAIHLNDSKGKAGCHLDRHENIGKGFIGNEGFRRVMNEPRFNDIPMILETPWLTDDINAEEIKLLYSFCNK